MNNNNGRKTKKERELNFNRYPKRRIALMFLYCGWEFDGFVQQPETLNTTEEAILSSMERTKIIPSKTLCDWNRCGRTDKGVSGFKQVGSCVVRSTDVNGEGVFWDDDEVVENRCTTTKEIDYTHVLNSALPSSVRVLAWAPVMPEFSARFNCKERVYRYIFPQSNFDVTRMNYACARLVGKHDFRNFCQIDNNKNRLNASYVREIFSAEITLISQSNTDSACNVCQLQVRGSGFLWHQIRFIVGLLFEIGLGNEEEDIVSALLDIKHHPARPQYIMAKDAPLCFYDCSFDLDLAWNFDSITLSRVFTQLKKTWTDLMIKTEIVRNMMVGVQELCNTDFWDKNEGTNTYLQGKHFTKKYIPILKRPTCDSIESRTAKVSSKRSRVETTESDLLANDDTIIL